MATSPNYAWAEPDNSSLVKNGAADIRTLGDAIDTSLWNVGFGQAGKNKLINGDFNIWQRGTSFTSSGYSADRWLIDADSTSFSQSRQAFTAGTAPVSGYEGTYFMRTTRGTGGSYVNSQQRIEDVRTFANQTVTLSFWAKASASCTIEPYYIQAFGSGGSGAVSGSFGTTTTLTTSWVRYSYTVTIPSVSGKTIGSSSYLNILVARITSATNVDVDTWGVQLEAGSKATPFQTATGTIQGEINACLRYFWKSDGFNTAVYGVGACADATNHYGFGYFPALMRVSPTATATAASSFYVTAPGVANVDSTGITLSTIKTNSYRIYSSTASNAAFAQGRAIVIENKSASAIEWSAEL